MTIDSDASDPTNKQNKCHAAYNTALSKKYTGIRLNRSIKNPTKKQPIKADAFGINKN
eukprot:CAMPEP_0202697256 /NCGR_PEP_ID=MMETSP1385-20130828/10583_1 /ASSEMBLY_ACC=CAM_ASM_000861 /TAXON_ID=933848 /ORGANISM="Elphidium margaritaceum" /LENGTH=57 /DNA_ID=CAMNT_0049353665 /DNA_START=408 /DNA_END=581 /DNA_ORIENTATION=-